jgi:hypothetical protein
MLPTIGVDRRGGGILTESIYLESSHNLFIVYACITSRILPTTPIYRGRVARYEVLSKYCAIRIYDRYWPLKS